MIKEKKIGIIAKGAIITLTASLIASGGGGVKLNKNTAWMTMNSYNKLKAEMIQKYEGGGKFTWQELEVFTDILNHEAKKGEFKNLTNITEKNLLPTLVNKVKN